MRRDDVTHVVFYYGIKGLDLNCWILFFKRAQPLLLFHLAVNCSFRIYQCLPFSSSTQPRYGASVFSKKTYCSFYYWWWKVIPSCQSTWSKETTWAFSLSIPGRVCVSSNSSKNLSFRFRTWADYIKHNNNRERRRCLFTLLQCHLPCCDFICICLSRLLN